MCIIKSSYKFIESKWGDYTIIFACTEGVILKKTEEVESDM